MPSDADDLFARAEAARTRAAAARVTSQCLEQTLYELTVESLMAQAQHALIRHTPQLDARLRLLLEHNEAPRREA